MNEMIDSYEGVIFKDVRAIYTPKEVYQNQSIMVKGDKITAIKPYADLVQEIAVKDYKIIQGDTSIATPGLIDAHSHPVFGGERSFELPLKTRGASYLEIQEKGGGINYTLEQTRKASKEELEENLEAILRQMSWNGTTVLEGKTGYHLTVEGELLALEVMNEVNKKGIVDVVPTFLGAHLVPPEYKQNPDEYVELIIEEMLPKVKKQGIARFTDVFCDKGAFTVEQSMKILRRSIELGIPIRVHADQFARLGLTRRVVEELQSFSIDHLLHTTLDDFELMIKHNVTPILIAADALVMFMDQIPFKGFHEYQEHIAIASDFNPNNWLVNMNLVLTYATYLWKFTPHNALVSATVNPAISLNETERGEIKIGKQADIILYHANDINQIPYHHGMLIPWFVMKQGRIMKEEASK